MATTEEVLSFIADFKGLSVESLSGNSPLGLSSLAGQRFRTSLQKKFGINIPEKDFKTISVHEVLKHLDGTISSNPVHVIHRQDKPTNLQSEMSSDIGIGIDIEHVEEFRTSLDPESDSFFVNTFTAAEIGYCLLQNDPAQHFAARFCAKEALRKCSDAYANLAFNEIQIANNQYGMPYYQIPDLHVELTDVSLSLSHTRDIAIAVAARRTMTNVLQDARASSQRQM